MPTPEVVIVSGWFGLVWFGLVWFGLVVRIDGYLGRLGPRFWPRGRSSWRGVEVGAGGHGLVMRDAGEVVFVNW